MTCSRTEFSQEQRVSCPPHATFAYNDFEFSETLATEWDSVCNQVSLHFLKFFQKKNGHISTLFVLLASKWCETCEIYKEISCTFFNPPSAT